MTEDQGDTPRVCEIEPANTSSVPQRSPLRYPGGKTWLIPHLRHWLRTYPHVDTLVEPFCGGATASLTAVMERFVDQAVIAEKDEDVAAFWASVLYEPQALVECIRRFRMNPETVHEMELKTPGSTLERGFRTLVLNRTRRGGILAKGASSIRRGESGAGVLSRWYPGTLSSRVLAIASVSERIRLVCGDGMPVAEHAAREGHAIFIDPPYTAGGKNAGKRLYRENDVDHEEVFRIASTAAGPVLMTYDMGEQIQELVSRHRLHATRVAMRNTHHRRTRELLITPAPVFPDRGPDLLSGLVPDPD